MTLKVVSWGVDVGGGGGGEGLLQGLRLVVTHACMYVCVCVYTYIYIYIYICNC